MRRAVLLGVLFLTTGVSARASNIILSENFDNIATLAGSGWILTNNSASIGVSDWFQGNAGVFTAQSGADDSYIAANFLNADFGGDVSNWLISPLINIQAGDVISYWTRTETSSVPGDFLELRTSAGGTGVGTPGTGTGDFSNLLQVIGDGGGGYPQGWTQESYTFSGPGDSVRLAFRYVVTDTSINGDYIGIDSLSVTAVPEPGTLALLTLGLMMIVAARVRLGYRWQTAMPRGIQRAHREDHVIFRNRQRDRG